MDLRVEKTLEVIEQSFLELRAKTDLNKIKINDLCTKAKINKTTFYRHYTDIYDLSDKIENETIDNMLKDFEEIDCLFKAPDKFINGMLTLAKQKYEEIILILFSDRIEVLVNKMESKIKSYYLPSNSSAEKNIVFSFIFRGSVNAILNTKTDIKALTDNDLKIFAKTVPSLLETLSSNNLVQKITSESATK